MCSFSTNLWTPAGFLTAYIQMFQMFRPMHTPSNFHWSSEGLWDAERSHNMCSKCFPTLYFFKLNDTAQWQLSCSRSQSAQLDVKSSPSSVIQHTYNVDIVVLRGIHCGRALPSFPLTTVISNSLTDTVGWNYQSVPEKCCEINHKNNKSALKCAWGWFRLFSITDQVFTWLSSWDDNSHCKQETNVVSVQEFDTARHRLTG